MEIDPKTQMKLSRSTVSFGVSLAAASVINGIVVVAKEKSPAVLAAMQKLTGHHWITHVLVILLIFAGGGWILGRANGEFAEKGIAAALTSIVVAGVLLGAVTIVGFYLLGD